MLEFARGKSPPHWVARYVGLPFREHGRTRDGLDCWGLVRLVLAEEFNIDVPSYAERYSSTLAQDEIGAFVPDIAAEWHDVPPGTEELGDVLVLRMRGQPMHVGLVLGGGRMLHVEQGIDSVMDDYRTRRWDGRIIGIYRYKKQL